MRKAQLLLFISIVLISCKQEKINQLQPTSPTKQLILNKVKPISKVKSNIKLLSHKPLIKTIVCHINPDMGLFKFKFYIDTTKYMLKKIKIYEGGKWLQTISESMEIQNNDCKIIDCNFDGYKDIVVLNNAGATGNAWYSIWNYSKEKNKFIENTELSKHSLIIDTKNKRLIYHYRCGFESEYWETHKYKNDTLVFVKRLLQEMWHDKSGNVWVKKTRSKLVNNIIVSTCDSGLYDDMKPYVDPIFRIKKKSDKQVIKQKSVQKGYYY